MNKTETKKEINDFINECLSDPGKFINDITIIDEFLEITFDNYLQSLKEPEESEEIFYLCMNTNKCPRCGKSLKDNINE